jgi:hypothetical protein
MTANGAFSRKIPNSGQVFCRVFPIASRIAQIRPFRLARYELLAA